MGDFEDIHVLKSKLKPILDLYYKFEQDRRYTFDLAMDIVREIKTESQNLSQVKSNEQISQDARHLHFQDATEGDPCECEIYHICLFECRNNPSCADSASPTKRPLHVCVCVCVCVVSVCGVCVCACV